jgi:hypothetical protein
MEVDCQCEFGYELQLVIPYAYYLYKNNLLNKTTSTFLQKNYIIFQKIIKKNIIKELTGIQMFQINHHI